MDEERTWQRIVEALRVLATANKLEVPTKLETTPGDQWERKAQRRNVLRGLLPKINSGLNASAADLPFDNLADLLDSAALAMLDKKPDQNKNGKKASASPIGEINSEG